MPRPWMDYAPARGSRAHWADVGADARYFGTGNAVTQQRRREAVERSIPCAARPAWNASEESAWSAMVQLQGVPHAKHLDAPTHA